MTTMTEKLTPIVPTKHTAPKAVARALLKLYRDPKRHSEGAFFRGVSGKPVDHGCCAIACCITGGIDLFAAEGCWGKVNAAFTAASRKLHRGYGLVHVNDGHGLEAIRAILKKVIES